MGLLDTGDPEKDAALYRGLLTAGLQLMQARGKFLPAVGQGGLAGLGGYENERNRQIAAKRIGLQDELLKGQAERQKQQSALDQIAGQYIKPDQQGNNPSSFVPGSMDLQGLIKAYMGAPGGLQTGLALHQALAPKPRKLTSVGQGNTLVDEETGQAVYTNPAADSEKESPIARLIKERDKFPVGDPTRRIFDDAIAKASTHQPGVSVSYGAPVAGVNEKGEQVFFQPDKSGKGPPAIVPGVKPAPQHRDTKLPAELQRMQIAGDAMGSLLNDYEAMLKKYNPRDPVTAANPTIRGEMQALKRNLELQFKELQALGALAGPDIEIMRQALSDPFSWQGAYFGRDGLLGQVAQARNLLKVRKEAVLRSQGKPDGAPVEDNDPLGIRPKTQ